MLHGESILCVVIFSRKRENQLWEIGINIFAEMEGNVSDEHFFENNSGKGRFLGDQVLLTNGRRCHGSRDGTQRDQSRHK